nr:MAG TPA: hypothetical protein [Caudoviricetes sp.]
MLIFHFFFLFRHTHSKKALKKMHNMAPCRKQNWSLYLCFGFNRT